MDDPQKERLIRLLRHRALQFARQQHIRPTDQPDFLQECQWQALRKGYDFLDTLLNRPEQSDHLYWFLRSVAGHFCRSQDTLRRHETPWSDLACPGTFDSALNEQDYITFEEGVLLQINVESVLQTLPKDQRSLFIRRHIYGEDYTSLARDFHTTEQAIRKRLSNIRHKLAAELISRGWSMD